MTTKPKEGSAAEEKKETPAFEKQEDERTESLKARYAKKPAKKPAPKK